MLSGQESTRAATQIAQNVCNETIPFIVRVWHQRDTVRNGRMYSYRLFFGVELISLRDVGLARESRH
jgi:hypothetical protein